MGGEGGGKRGVAKGTRRERQENIKIWQKTIDKGGSVRYNEDVHLTPLGCTSLCLGIWVPYWFTILEPAFAL